MAARALLVSCAVLAIAYAAYAQDIAVQVYPQVSQSRQFLVNEYIDIVTQLNAARAEAERLYTDFTSRMANNMNSAIKNITSCIESIRRDCNPPYCHGSNDQCWVTLDYRLQKIEHDSRKKAEDSTEVHQKYLKGYMLVLRMHLNKSENFLRRYHRFVRGCRISCQATIRVRRCHRLALDKIRRVRNDLPFTRRSYHDLLCHSRLELREFERLAFLQSRQAVNDYRTCFDTRR